MVKWIKNNSNKMVLMGKTLVFFVILLCFIGCNYLYYNYVQTVTESVQSFNINDPVIEVEMAGEGDRIEQTIRLQRPRLKSIVWRLQADALDEDADILEVALLQGETIIARERVAASDIYASEYYVFLINKKLSTYKNYTLRISYAPSGQASEVGLTQAHAKENIGNCKVNGVTAEGELSVNYVYEIVDPVLARNWIIKDIIFLIGIALLIGINKWLEKREKIHKVLGFVYWLVIPFVTFVLVEFVTGNLFGLKTEVVVKNLVLYYVAYFALSLVLRKVSTLTFSYVAIFMLLSLIQYFVTAFRGRPFMLQDIFSVKTAATVASTYYFEINAIMFYVLLAGIALLICSCCFGERFLQKKYYIRVICLALSLGALYGANVRYDKFLPTLNMWFLNDNYSEHGLVLTLVAQVPYMTLDEPENYSVDMVNAIAESVGDMPIAETTPQNIILIMNESFADLECFAEVKTDTELLPFWKSLSENTIKGYLNVPVFGAGTSNSEYEVLTGNSMEFVVGGSVPYQINVQNGDSSMVSILEAQGYESIALHPYPAENWNRSNVYPNMGFDEFISMENWGKYELIRWCPSDKTAYDKLIEKYEDVDGKWFAFLVTMQNHGGYATDYDNFVVDVELKYETDYSQAERYFSLLQESDRAYQDLIEYFSDVDESTMIIMFGDHQAAIENEYYEELFGKPLSELSFEEQQMRYVTPFMIWTNYDIEEQENVRMSSNYFGSYIMDIAGVELPAYNRFLLNTMQEIPIIGIGGICGSDGVWYDWNNLPEQYSELINEYKILQYNNIYDRKNRVDSVYNIVSE